MNNLSLQDALKQCNTKQEAIDIVKPGYKLIPTYEDYCINQEGKIFSLKIGKYIKPIEDEGFKKVNLFRGTRKKYYTLEVHVLLAMCWIPIPESLKIYSINRLTVYHLDSDTTNNSLSNLRWAKKRDVKNLRSKNRGKVLVCNLRTGKIDKLDLLSDVTDKFGITTDLLLDAIKCNKVFNYKYVAKFERYPRHWISTRRLQLTNHVKDERYLFNDYHEVNDFLTNSFTEEEVKTTIKYNEKLKGYEYYIGYVWL